MVLSILLNQFYTPHPMFIRHLCAVLIAGVTSEGQPDPSGASMSQGSSLEEEEGREAEAATRGTDSKTNLPSPATVNTARRSATGRIGRARGTRASSGWSNISTRGGIRPNLDPTQGETYDLCNVSCRLQHPTKCYKMM